MKVLLPLMLGLFFMAGCTEKAPDIAINEPYAFATNGVNGAVFLTIENTGGADTLLSATTNAAATVEIHETTMNDGVMTMRKIDSLAIPAGENISLEPRGLHIMLMGLTAPLVAGERFDLSLNFDKSGEMTFPVMIGAAGQKPVHEDHDHDHDHEGHDDHADHDHSEDDAHSHHNH